MFENYEGYNDDSRFKNAIFSLLVEINNKLDKLNNPIDECTITKEDAQEEVPKPTRKRAKVVKDNA